MRTTMAIVGIGSLLALGGCVEMTGDDGSADDESTIDQEVSCPTCGTFHNGCKSADTLSQCQARHPTATLSTICAFVSRSDAVNASSVIFRFAPPSTGTANNWRQTWWYRDPTAMYNWAAQTGYPSTGWLVAQPGYPSNTWDLSMQAYCGQSYANAIILGTPYVGTPSVPQGSPTSTPADAATCSATGYSWQNQPHPDGSAQWLCVAPSYSSVFTADNNIGRPQ